MAAAGSLDAPCHREAAPSWSSDRTASPPPRFRHDVPNARARCGPDHLRLSRISSPTAPHRGTELGRGAPRRSSSSCPGQKPLRLSSRSVMTRQWRPATAPGSASGSTCSDAPMRPSANPVRFAVDRPPSPGQFAVSVGGQVPKVALEVGPGDVGPSPGSLGGTGLPGHAHGERGQRVRRARPPAWVPRHVADPTPCPPPSADDSGAHPRPEQLFRTSRMFVGSFARLMGAPAAQRLL